MTAKTKTPALRLGFGASGAWGERWFSTRQAERLVARALEKGITHFDTAGFYANGVAEERLGAALKQTTRENIIVSSKVGTRNALGGRKIKDFSVAAIRADVNASLKRLGRSHIDILYLHGPTSQQIDSTRNVLQMLKQEGKIGAIGICGVSTQLDFAVKTQAADVIMGLYNAFDRSHADVFQSAKAQNIQTVSVAPLGQALYRRGLLIPKSRADIWYLARALGRNRKKLTYARHVAANALRDIKGHTPASAMLAFALANSDIDTVMTNTTRLNHLDESINTALSPSLDAETLSRLSRLERNPDKG